MVTTWHPVLKYLSKILQEKIINILKRTSALKKVLPEKPIIAFCKMKSIRNYIVRTDIKETNDKKN